MKKWMLMMIILLGLTMMTTGCQEELLSDNTAPVVLGMQDITYTIGDTIPDLLSGITASDDVDGDVLSSALIEENINWTTAGVYAVHISFKDSKNNITDITFYVTVDEAIDEDTTPPLILNTQDITYVIGDTYPDLADGVTAYDETDGVITSSLTIDSTLVNWEIPGNYTITYRVADAKGNTTEIDITLSIHEQDLSEPIELKIYYINDTHGAIQPSGASMGLARIANLILSEKNNHPEQTIFIGGGDLLQGNILSNYFYGSSMIDMLNLMEMDAFVMGNHEFDWGLDRLLAYFDPETTGISAQFPLLAANVFNKGTTTYPDHISPYTILDRADLRIGIIGLMGYGLESSIATSMVQDYYFDDPVTWAAHYADYLREEEQVDVVIAVVHGASDYTNQMLGQLSGSEKIDVTFNGHSHENYVRFEARSGVDMPVVQSGANGSMVGEVTLTIDSVGKITDYQARNLTEYNEARLANPLQAMEDLIETYVTQIEPLLTEVIITSGESYSKQQLTTFMAKLIRLSVDADLGIHNYGGTRSELYQGQEITVATLYQIFPFDNKIKHVYLTGREIKDYANSADYIDFKPGLSLSALSDDSYYKVATNDYIFDKTYNPFIDGTDPVDTGILIRDVLENVLRQQATLYPSFDIDRPITLSQNMTNYWVRLTYQIFSRESQNTYI